MNNENSASSRDPRRSTAIVDRRPTSSRRRSEPAPASLKAGDHRRAYAAPEPLEARLVPTGLGLLSLASVLPVGPLATTLGMQDVLATGAVGPAESHGPGESGPGISVAIDDVASLGLELSPLIHTVDDVGGALGPPLGDAFGSLIDTVAGVTSGPDLGGRGMSLSVGGPSGLLGAGLSIMGAGASLTLPGIGASVDLGGSTSPGTPGGQPGGGGPVVPTNPGIPGGAGGEPSLPTGPTLPGGFDLPVNTGSPGGADFPTLSGGGAPTAPVIAPPPGAGSGSPVGGGTAGTPGTPPADLLTFGATSALQQVVVAPVGAASDEPDRAPGVARVDASLAVDAPVAIVAAPAQVNPGRVDDGQSRVEEAPASPSTVAAVATPAADSESATEVPVSPAAVYLRDLDGLERALADLRARFSHLGEELAEQVTQLSLFQMLLAAGLGVMAFEVLRRLDQRQQAASPRGQLGFSSLPGPFYLPKARFGRS